MSISPACKLSTLKGRYYVHELKLSRSKGQLISKCLFGIFNSPKKRTKKFNFTNMLPQSNCFCFLRELKTTVTLELFRPSVIRGSWIIPDFGDSLKFPFSVFSFAFCYYVSEHHYTTVYPTKASDAG